MKKILLLIILGNIVLSCISDNIVTEGRKYNFSFYIPEMDLTITTSKQVGAKFYTLFSKDSITWLPDSIISLPDTIDYIMNQTHEMGPINIILNPAQKDSIYIREDEFIKHIQCFNYKLCVLTGKEFDTRFFEPRILTQPLILKYPYICIVIFTNSYLIINESYKVTQRTIKEGSVYGF